MCFWATGTLLQEIYFLNPQLLGTYALLPPPLKGGRRHQGVSPFNNSRSIGLPTEPVGKRKKKTQGNGKDGTVRNKDAVPLNSFRMFRVNELMLWNSTGSHGSHAWKEDNTVQECSTCRAPLKNQSTFPFYRVKTEEDCLSLITKTKNCLPNKFSRNCSQAIPGCIDAFKQTALGNRFFKHCSFPKSFANQVS